MLLQVASNHRAELTFTNPDFRICYLQMREKNAMSGLKEDIQINKLFMNAEGLQRRIEVWPGNTGLDVWADGV